MALDAISSSVYQGTSSNIQKPKTDVSIPETNSLNLNITEIPTAKVTSKESQTGDSQENGQKNNPATEKQIKDAVDKANDKMRMHRTKIEFSYHQEINRVSIKVLDQDTDEVIREIPPEETLKMVEKMWELAGLLVDERR